MTTSARLPRDLERRLRQYCEAQGTTKTRVIETALKRWLDEARETGKHPAALAFDRIEPLLKPERTVLRRNGRSSDAVRRAIRAKHSD
jgi:predicted DNA-binding protein